MKKEMANIKLGYSQLGTGNIYIYRHGKDPNLALEKREAEFDVMYNFKNEMEHQGFSSSLIKGIITSYKKILSDM